MDRLRIDKWLWAARFYKTRSLAAEDIGKHRVQVNGDIAKASREVKAGDTVAMRHNATVRTVVVRGLSKQRGPAPAAQLLYEETPESLVAQAQAREARRLGSEPALTIAQGRPTKRERRDLDDASRGWGTRWSASLEDGEGGVTRPLGSPDRRAGGSIAARQRPKKSFGCSTNVFIDIPGATLSIHCEEFDRPLANSPRILPSISSE